MRLLLVVALGLGLGLAACEQKAAPPAPTAPRKLVAPADGVWDLLSSGEGVVMVHRTRVGEAKGVDLRVACLYDKGVILYAETLDFVVGQDRLVLRAGEQAFSVDAAIATDRKPPMLKGKAAISGPMIALLTSPRPLTLTYGDKTAGPFQPAPTDLRQAFAAACHEIPKGRPKL